MSVFLVSTTGLPLSLHVCSMKGLTSASSCKMHKVMKEDHSCCSKEEESQVKLNLDNYDSCCQFKVVEKNNSDQIISINNDFGSVKNLKVPVSVTADFYQSPEVSIQFSYKNTSPPPLADNHIYLTNSILLI